MGGGHGVARSGRGPDPPMTHDLATRNRAPGHGSAWRRWPLALVPVLLGLAYVGVDALLARSPSLEAMVPDDLVAHLHPVESRAAFHFRHQRESKFTHRTAHPEHPKVMGWFRNVVPVDPATTPLPHDDLLRVSLFYGTREVCDEGWHALSDDARTRLHREVFPMSLFPEFADVDLVLTEIQRKGRGKAEALRLLAERYGVPAARVVAFGDQHNDLPLLREVGLPIAMGNAIAQAKELAHHVIAPHTDDGVARFLADHLR